MAPSPPLWVAQASLASVLVSFTLKTFIHLTNLFLADVNFSAILGRSSATAAASATALRAAYGYTPADGTYWLQFASGSNTPFLAHIIYSKPDGPWVKAVQWSGGIDVSGAGAVNSGGAWINNQIGLAAGKLPSADINLMIQQNGGTLWRVTGGYLCSFYFYLSCRDLHFS